MKFALGNMSKNILIYIFILAAFIFQNLDVNGSTFRVTGRIKVDQGVVEGAGIVLYRDGTPAQEANINRTGNFVFSLDIGHLYRMDFKKEGFYSKCIEIDTHVPEKNCPSNNCEFPPYQLSIFLLKMVPGVDMKEAVAGRIVYNPTIDNFDIAKKTEKPDYKKLVTEAITKAKKESIDIENKTRDTKERKYQSHIRQAETKYRGGYYVDAMEEYRNALTIKPYEKTPREKVDELYRLVTIDNLKKSYGAPSRESLSKYTSYAEAKDKERESTLAMIAYEMSLKVTPDDASMKAKYEKAKKETEELKQLVNSELTHKQTQYSSRQKKYNTLIAEADQCAVSEKFAEANEKYALAAGQIEENSYAMLMLKSLDEILNNDDIALRQAKEREEREKKQIQEARERAYKDAIAEADRLMENRLYRDANEYYELALSIKTWEQYPKDQIRKIKSLLAAMQLNGTEYNKLLREAESLFSSEQYAEARPVYQQAHDMMPNETFALSQIRKIDALLSASANDENYRKAIATADARLAERQYQQAIDNYQQAKKIKPAERYPVDQIEKIRQILLQENNSQISTTKKQTDYDQYISLADIAFKNKEYQNAKNGYTKALALKPNEEYPKSQIEAINKILNADKKQTTNSILDRIDFSHLENVSKADRELAYQEAMKMGNSFFNTKEWGISRFYYRKALDLKPNDQSAQSKLNEVEKQIRGGDINESLYNEMVKKGDEAFRTGDFSVSKFYYSKALSARPNDNYATERLAVTQQMITSESKRANNKDYESAMQKGNEAFEQNNYSVARFFYRRALTVKPNDAEASKKAKEVEAILSESKASTENNYQKYIDQADKYFNSKDYDSARKNYKQAILIDSKSDYAKKQISKIDSLTSR